MGSALLVIDMQQGSFTPATPRFNQKGVVENINLVAREFRKKQFPIIFVQHDGSREGSFLPNTPEWKLLPDLTVEPQDLMIQKQANDAFCNTRLEALLKENGIRNLFITGCATDFCVEATLHAAFTKGYKVSAIADAHTTEDRPNLKAKAVIAHYNWVWAQMTPINCNIEVITAKGAIETMMTTP